MTSLMIVMLVSVLRLAIPIIITGLGNMYCERAGVMNLGAEGMMIAGAFGAAAGAYITGNAWIGVLTGIAGGMVIAAIHSLICVEFGGIQNISGLGLNMLAAGLTAFFCRSIFGTSISATVASIQSTPVLSKIPVIGGFLSQFSPIAYIAVALIGVSWFVMKKTVWGFRLVSVGDDPQTVITAGIDVWKLRHMGVLICGAFAGLAGAYLSIGQLNIFMEDMTNGKGMLAVIAVKMGRWDPVRIVCVALLFGFFDALQLQLQISNAFDLSPEILQTIPFILGIIALAVDSSSNVNPKSITQPYLKAKYKY